MGLRSGGLGPLWDAQRCPWALCSCAVMRAELSSSATSVWTHGLWVCSAGSEQSHRWLRWARRGAARLGCWLCRAVGETGTGSASSRCGFWRGKAPGSPPAGIINSAWGPVALSSCACELRVAQLHGAAVWAPALGRCCSYPQLVYTHGEAESFPMCHGEAELLFVPLEGLSLTQGRIKVWAPVLSSLLGQICKPT